MSSAGRRSTRGLLSFLAVLVPLLIAAAPASAGDIVINEVETQDPTGGGDWIEIYNSGAGTVNVSDYKLKDSNNGNVFAVPPGTLLADGEAYASNTLGFGLSDIDSARVFLPNGTTLLDTYSWTSHAARTWGRCPDGTGAFGQTVSETFGTANNCQPASATSWPGGSTTTIVDGPAPIFGANLSGLTYQPSGTSAPGVLWASRNNPSRLYRLVKSGGSWLPDTANGWSSGKQLLFPGDVGNPDAEGVTFAGGDADGIYASTERNDTPADEDVSRPSILRFDTSGAGASLTATNEWNLAPDLGALDSNQGLEAIGWVPDSLLTSKGFVDEATGLTYDPAAYANHGSGIFFVGVEQTGQVRGYALNLGGSTFTRVATIDSGFPAVMDLEYEPESTHLWVACDDSCNGRTKILDIAQSGPNDGKFVATDTYERPSGSPNLNNEGFAITPQAECSGGKKPTFYADDSNTGGHAISSGTINCTDLPTPPVTDPDTDRDGVLDSSDGCPTVVGPASNNGCPVKVTPPGDDKACDSARAKLAKAKAKLKKLKKAEAPKGKIKSAKAKVKKAKAGVKKAC